MNKNKPYVVLRWTARIYGMLILASVLYIAIPEYIEDLRNAGSLSAFLSAMSSELKKYPQIYLPWVTGCAGYILALWKEGLGGGISLISFIISLFAMGFPRQPNVFALFVIVSIPSILYLIYWWKMNSL